MFMGRATDMVFGRHRIAVIGDVGGVLSCFDHVLGRLGVIGDVLPVGLTVVQLGDLVGGQGHDSALLDRVDRLMTANPGSWLQLAGNWESRHLPGFVRFDPRKERNGLNATDAELLGSWWRDGHLRVAAAIDTLAASGEQAWLVLGDMRELGADEVALHAQAGARAKAAGIARLYTLGVLSKAASDAFGEGARAFATHAQLADALADELRAGVRVLVKGSRGSAMDRIVKALLASDAAVENGDADAA